MLFVKKTLIYCLLTTFLIIPLISSAQCASPLNPTTYCSFLDIFSAIAKTLKTFGQPIAIIMFLYGGFLYLTSGGNQEKVKMAHRTMTWSAVGLGVIMIGSALVSIICSFLGATQCPI